MNGTLKKTDFSKLVLLSVRVTAKSKDKEFDREIIRTSFYPFRDHSKIIRRGGEVREGREQGTIGVDVSFFLAPILMSFFFCMA